MQQIIEALKQALLDQHIPNEQIQNILSSIDLTQINLQDIPASKEYLDQLLSGFNLQETIINNINLDLFNNLGITNISDLGQNSDDILSNIGNMLGGFFGGE